MSDERLLGQILANQENHQKAIDEIKVDVRSLNEFRWSWLGRITLVSSVLGAVVSGLVEWFVYHR